MGRRQYVQGLQQERDLKFLEVIYIGFMHGALII